MIGNIIFASYRVLAFQVSRRWLNINCHSHHSTYQDTCAFVYTSYPVQNGDQNVSYDQSCGLALLREWNRGLLTLNNSRSEEIPRISAYERAPTPHHLD